MELKRQRLKTSLLAANTGQIAGLPTNPRQWTRDELETLKKSISETPELLEARGIIVVPSGGEYVVLGGNMRLEAAKALGMTDVPCIIVPEDTAADKLKEIVIKDNGSFGAWDYDSLANEWDDLPLSDWGVPAWSTSEEIDYGALEIDTVAEAGKAESGMESISFIFSQEDAAIVKEYIAQYTKEGLVNKIVELCRTPEAR